MTSRMIDHVGAFVGDPDLMVPGATSGPLSGTTLAVKDLFDIEGAVTGAGNPTWAATHPPATSTAPAVRRLVDAGASVVGKTVTDELAFSLSGTNVHHGTPANVAAPDRIPGGSSAGSASAIAAGLVDLALGTDTAGSIRVPASYCGIAGWRSTHGSIPMDGVVPLAPSYDTVGLFARDLSLLAIAASALLGERDATAPPTSVRWLAECVGDVEPAVADAVARRLSPWVDPADAVDLGIGLDVALGAQRTRQTWEAWQAHGRWIDEHEPGFGPGVAARFRAGSEVVEDDVERADVVAAEVRRRMRDLLGTSVLAVPAAAGPPPPIDAGADRTLHEQRRASTLRLTCTAGLAGAPVVVIPGASVDGLPVGVALIGPPGSDVGLIELAADLSAEREVR